MELRARSFTKDAAGEKELNEFLATAHLYHTDSSPAVRVFEHSITVFHVPDISRLAPHIAAETILSKVRKLREILVEYEMDLRQFGWRIVRKEEEVKERTEKVEKLEAQKAELEAKLQDIPKKDAAEVRAELREVNETLKGEKEELGEAQTQLANAAENIAITERKADDTRKDIDQGLQLAADLESGDFPIYRQGAEGNA